MPALVGETGALRGIVNTRAPCLLVCGHWGACHSVPTTSCMMAAALTSARSLAGSAAVGRLGAVLSRQGQEAGVAGGRLLECRARATRATPSPCAPPSVGGAGQKPLGLGAPYVTMPAQVPRLQASGVSITAHGQSEAPPPPPRVTGAPRPALRLQGADGTCRVWDSRPRGP